MLAISEMNYSYWGVRLSRSRAVRMSLSMRVLLYFVCKYKYKICLNLFFPNFFIHVNDSHDGHQTCVLANGHDIRL